MSLQELALDGSLARGDLPVPPGRRLAAAVVAGGVTLGLLGHWSTCIFYPGHDHIGPVAGSLWWLALGLTTWFLGVTGASGRPGARGDASPRVSSDLPEPRASALRFLTLHFLLGALPSTFLEDACQVLFLLPFGALWLLLAPWLVAAWVDRPGDGPLANLYRLVDRRVLAGLAVQAVLLAVAPWLVGVGFVQGAAGVMAVLAAGVTGAAWLVTGQIEGWLDRSALERM